MKLPFVLVVAVLLLVACFALWLLNQPDGSVEIGTTSAPTAETQKVPRPSALHRDEVRRDPLEELATSENIKVASNQPNQERKEELQETDGQKKGPLEISIEKSVEGRSRTNIAALELSDADKATLSQILAPIEDELVDLRLRFEKKIRDCEMNKAERGLYKTDDSPMRPGAISGAYRALPTREIVWVEIMPGEFPELDMLRDEEKEILRRRNEVLRSFGVKLRRHDPEVRLGEQDRR
ncbi:MAG: hypothetical protein AB1486_34860 [Planctomycetota bacterium]